MPSSERKKFEAADGWPPAVKVVPGRPLGDGSTCWQAVHPLWPDFVASGADPDRDRRLHEPLMRHASISVLRKSLESRGYLAVGPSTISLNPQSGSEAWERSPKSE
jgi:hypothetical protein